MLLLLSCRTIKDALYDSQVFECFQVTLSRCKKSARATAVGGGGGGGGGGVTRENKSAIEEFEQLMSQIHAQSEGIIIEEEGSDNNSTAAAAAVSFHRDLADDSDDDGDDNDYEGNEMIQALLR